MDSKDKFEQELEKLILSNKYYAEKFIEDIITEKAHQFVGLGLQYALDLYRKYKLMENAEKQSEIIKQSQNIDEFKNVGYGNEPVGGAPRSITKIEATEEEIMSDKNDSVANAIKVLSEALKTNAGYRQGWIANISVCCYDALRENKDGDSGLMKRCNEGAEKFLDLLTSTTKSEGLFGQLPNHYFSWLKFAEDYARYVLDNQQGKTLVFNNDEYLKYLDAELQSMKDCNNDNACHALKYAKNKYLRCQQSEKTCEWIEIDKGLTIPTCTDSLQSIPKNYCPCCGGRITIKEADNEIRS